MDSPEQIERWLDEERRFIAESIERDGFAVFAIAAEPETRSTASAYTVGLTELGHPELLTLGLPGRTAHSLLTEVAARVRRGEVLTPGELLTFADWSHRVVVESVPNPEQILLAVGTYYDGADAPTGALQLTYDDRAGRFPWEDGYSVAAWIQPRPGEFRA